MELLNNLRSKLLVIIVSAVVIPMICAVFIANSMVAEALNKRQQELFNSSINAAQEIIEKAKTDGQLLAKELHNNPSLVAGVAEGNRSKILEAIAENYKIANEEIKVDAMYVTDKNNKVLARAHSPAKFGDDKNHVLVFGQALKNNKAYKDWAIGKTGIEVLGAMPIEKDGKTIGVIAVGQHANQDMVEAINKVVQGEVALYWNDTVCATNNEEVKIGDKIEDKDVINRVLKQGNILQFINNDEGSAENAAFIPLKDMQENVLGAVYIEKDRTQLISDLNAIRNYLLLTGFILTVIGIIVALWFSRRIAMPIQEMALAGQAVASGDLTVNVKVSSSNDEVGTLARSFEQMVTTLSSLIKQISSSAESVVTISNELTDNAKDTAHISGEVNNALEAMTISNGRQSSSIQDVSSNIEQLTTAVSQIAAGAQEQAQSVNNGLNMVNKMVGRLEDVAHNTGAIALAAKQASEAAQKGGEIVRQTIAGMVRIKETVTDSGERIIELGEQSKAIGEIIQVIDEIAEQTNLLALNAAIEAARAGEHGKGFAVVADEVRKLAERSGKATKQIAQLINNIQQETGKAVESMNTGISEVEKGSEFAKNAGLALDEILMTVEKAVEQMQSISGTIKEISEDSTQVVNVISSVASITEENSAATEQMSAGSLEVSRAVDEMTRIAEENTRVTQTVETSANRLSNSAEKIANSVQNLSSMATELKQTIRKFKTQ